MLGSCTVSQSHPHPEGCARQSPWWWWCAWKVCCGGVASAVLLRHWVGLRSLAFVLTEDALGEQANSGEGGDGLPMREEWFVNGDGSLLHRLFKSPRRWNVSAERRRCAFLPRDLGDGVMLQLGGKILEVACRNASLVLGFDG